jgi:hypothetical protein
MAAVGGCSSALDEDSGTDSAEIGKCKPKSELSGDVLTPKEVARLLREAGVAEAEVPKMVCIAKYESRFFSEAHRLNENCTHDYGLFQINSHWWSKACDATAEELMDPATNARCAKIVRERDVNHFSAWHAYRSHKHECDTYKIPD